MTTTTAEPVPLTARQQTILAFFTDHCEREGRSPTIREVMAHFGFTSVNAVHCHVRPLVKKGYLKRLGGAGSARSFVPVAPEGAAALTASRTPSGMLRLRVRGRR